MKHAVKNIHFVGIGGAGMSAIAEVLHTQGYGVSGSDQNDGAVTRRLAGLGIRIHIGHDAAHIAGLIANTFWREPQSTVLSWIQALPSSDNPLAAVH